jgi:cytochrome c-type biogenesis protein CcmH
MRALLLLLALLLVPPPALAVEPDEILADPALEARARALSQIVRCVVCQNESIDSSGADIARDLRLLIRERLVAGDSDQQVLDYLVARYGNFILLEPPLEPSTLLLWAAPALVLLLGGALVVVVLRQRRRAAEPAPLSAEEERRLGDLLSGGRQGGPQGGPQGRPQGENGR